jgi:hypothetical protein
LLFGCALLPLVTSASVLAQQRDGGFEHEAKRYFDAERDGAIILMAIGMLGLSAGSGMLAFSNDRRVRGAAYPTLLFGVVQLTAGAFTFAHVEGHRQAAQNAAFGDRQAFVRSESARSRAAIDSFVIVEIVEIAIIAGGVTTAALSSARSRHTLQGVGLGLASQALITMTWDLTAHARASRYLEAVGSLDISAGVGSQGSTLTIGWAFQ